jgi:hypothetical protein
MFQAVLFISLEVFSVSPCLRGEKLHNGTFYALTVSVPATTPVGFFLRAFFILKGATHGNCM